MKTIDKVEFCVADGAGVAWNADNNLWKRVKTYNSPSLDSLNNFEVAFNLSSYITPASGKFVSYKILITYTNNSNVANNYYHITFQASTIVDKLGVSGALFCFAKANDAPSSVTITSSDNKVSSPLTISFSGGGTGGTWKNKFVIRLDVSRTSNNTGGFYTTVYRTTDLNRTVSINLINNAESGTGRLYSGMPIFYVRAFVYATDIYGFTTSEIVYSTDNIKLFNDASSMRYRLKNTTETYEEYKWRQIQNLLNVKLINGGVAHGVSIEGNNPNKVYVRTVDDLKQISDNVNNGIDSYKGKTIYLMNDILDIGDWEPIGHQRVLTSEFEGTFDGQGHSVGYYTIVSNISLDNCGLFGVNSGVIKNLTVRDSRIDMQKNGNAGIIAARNRGTIENCKVNYSIIYGHMNIDTSSSTSNYLGGICGTNSGYVRKCIVFSGQVHGEDDGGDTVGGICGDNSNGTIAACRVNATSLIGYQLGGIAGYSTGYNTIIENCCVRGSLGDNSTEYMGYTGGIIGYQYRGTIRNCFVRNKC